MKFKVTFLLLLISAFAKIQAADPVVSGAYRLSSGRTPSKVMTVNDNGKLIVSAKNNSDLSQVWLIYKTGTGNNGTSYTLRNASTGQFVQTQGGLSQNYYTNNSMTSLYVRNNPSLSGYFNFSNEDKFTGFTCLHEDAAGNVVPWSPGAGSTASGTEWKLESVTEFTTEQIRENLLSKSPYSAIATGTAFRIISTPYGKAMCENSSDNSVTTEAIGNDVSQYWKFVKTSAGYKIKNLYTDRYIKKQNGAISTQYTTAAYLSDAFTIRENTNFPYDIIYDIVDASNIALHCGSTQSYDVVGWYTSDGQSNLASTWKLQKVDVSDEEIAAAHKKYTDQQKIINTIATTRSRVMTFFKDYACTSLKEEYDAMSDSALTAAMSSLPDDIINMALKIKNNKWTKWEKEFRIAKYGIYSDPQYWGSTLSMTPYGRQNNPTGITADRNDLVYVYVGSNVPSGATLTLETTSTTSVWGTYSKALTRGVNVFTAPEDNSQIYINYISANGSLISSYDSLQIHIEGGRVNGFFNTSLYSNDDWEEMKSDGLFSGPVLDVKGKYVMMHMNSSLFKQYVGKDVHRIIKAWDRIVREEFNLMGLFENNQYPDIYEGVYPSKFNNLMECVSIDYSYMFSTSNFTAYNESTLSSILNSENMDSGSNIWGPAHEIGHSNQGAIKIIGSTEISNNLFSNLMVYKTGTYTSRGWNMQTEQPMLADRLSWPERYNKGEIMSMTQMFYQMYLYYHVLGHDTTFYQKVFHELRKDPLQHPSTPGVVYGRNDYLKFARVCAKAAGENLNDFFQYWGFYFPVNALAVSDYSNYTVTTTQSDIDATKEYIAKCGKSNPQIIFIEDRVRPVKKTDGTYKLSLSENSYADCKNKMGQYEDYPLNLEPSGYIYSVNSTGVVNVPSTAKNAVGMIVYDKDSNLVYAASTYSFTIPAYVRQQGGYKIYAVRSDGELIKMFNRSMDKYYTLKIYRNGNRSAITRYTDGTVSSGTIPTVAGNDIVWLSTANAPEAITGMTNVIDNYGVANNVVLDDSLGFYAPVNFTAKSLKFISHIGTKISNKAYPFSFAVSDIKSVARPENISGISVANDSIFIDLVTATDSVKAGDPVFLVLNNGTTGEWSYSGTNVPILGSGKSVSLDENVTATTNFSESSYTGKIWQYVANDLRYIESSDATVSLTPFTSSLRSSSSNAPLYYYLRGDMVNGILQVRYSAQKNDYRIYDLDGMPVFSPQKGKIYIVNGKKVLF